MTLKFFSMFFWQVCKLNPVAVSSISLAAPLCISLVAALCQRLSPRCALHAHNHYRICLFHPRHLEQAEVALVCRKL